MHAIFEQPGLSGSLTYQEGLETQTLAFSVKPMKCSMAPWLIKASGHAAALEWVQVILSDLVTTVRYNMVVRSFFSGNGVIFCRSVVQCVCVCGCVIICTYHTVPYHTIPDHTLPLHCIALLYTPTFNTLHCNTCANPFMH